MDFPSHSSLIPGQCFEAYSSLLLPHPYLFIRGHLSTQFDCVSLAADQEPSILALAVVQQIKNHRSSLWSLCSRSRSIDLSFGCCAAEQDPSILALAVVQQIKIHRS
jgi:hypothetical protein